MKIVTIIENNPITGVKYGTVEIQGSTQKIQDAYKRTQDKIRDIRAAKRHRTNIKHK